MSTLTPLPSWDARVDTSGVIRSHALHLTKDSLVFYLDVLGWGGRLVFSILSRLHVLLGNCLPAWGALVNRLQLLSNSTEDTNRDLILKKLWNCEDLSMFLDLDSLKANRQSLHKAWSQLQTRGLSVRYLLEHSMIRFNLETFEIRKK